MSGWRVQETNFPISASAALELLRSRTADHRYETWFEHDDGRLLGVVTNGERAMMLLLDDDGDPGEHAVDPTAAASESNGYRLGNGQVDTYPDADTVPFETAMRLVHDIITGHPRRPADWCIDR